MAKGIGYHFNEYKKERTKWWQEKQESKKSAPTNNDQKKKKKKMKKELTDESKSETLTGAKSKLEQTVCWVFRKLSYTKFDFLDC